MLLYNYLFMSFCQFLFVGFKKLSADKKQFNGVGKLTDAAFFSDVLPLLPD
jgi:hypothetical protein